jgi:hypothetical protein
MLWTFAVVQKYLQISTFYLYGRSVCSLLFMCVVVKLSSIVRLAPLLLWSTAYGTVTLNPTS